MATTKLESQLRNQQLALTNLRRANASLSRALTASDRELQKCKDAIVAWYDNTYGETEVEEELALIELAKRFKGQK